MAQVIKTVLLCGQQNFALRGHRETGNVLLDPSEAGERNDGNFPTLLRFRIDTGDWILEQHLTHAPKNATYISGRIQNEIINAVGSLIRKKIVAEVNTAEFFSVLANEARDISKSDQLTVCLRYVTLNKEGQYVLRENILSFFVVTTKTGAALAESILKVLRDEGVVVGNMRSQGYDGCSSMRGIYKGVQAEPKKIVPQALYFHCASHCLNLALAHSVENTKIKLAIGTIASTCAFLSGSSQRVKLFQDAVESLLPESKVRRLKPLCATRWVESHKAYIVFKQLLKPIVHTLGEISEDGGDSGVRANELLSAICKCEFVVSLFIVERFAALFLPLSIQIWSVEEYKRRCRR